MSHGTFYGICENKCLVPITPDSVGAAPDGLVTEMFSPASDDELMEIFDAQLSTMALNSVRFIAFTGSNTSLGTGRWVARVTKTVETAAVVEMVCHGNNGASTAYENKTNGTWAGIEWLNPPMKLGTEYRTVERWDNKAVYTKRLNIGTLPSNSTKDISHGVSASTMLWCSGTTSYGATLPFKSGTAAINISANLSNIVVECNVDLSSYTGEAQIWYTKD